MKNKLQILSISTLTAVALALPLHAADKKGDKANATTMASPAASAAAEAKTKKLPFKGKIASVDKDKKTITLETKGGEGRTIVVGDTTKLLKSEGDAPATWDDLKVGEEVRGSYTKTDDGKLEAAKIKVGAKSEKAADEKARPEATKAVKKETKKS